MLLAISYTVCCTLLIKKLRIFSAFLRLFWKKNRCRKRRIEFSQKSQSSLTLPVCLVSTIFALVCVRDVWLFHISKRMCTIKAAACYCCCCCCCCNSPLYAFTFFCIHFLSIIIIIVATGFSCERVSTYVFQVPSRFLICIA